MSTSSFPTQGGERRRRIAVAAALVGLVSTPLALGFSTPANAAVDHLVINEVYGGGGSTSTSPTPAYKVDFVELYNPTNGPLSTSGLSLQYRSATFSSTTPPAALELPSASVGAGDTFLVQVSLPNACTGGATCAGADLPPPDFTATTTVLNMAAGAGQVILAQGTTGITATGSSMHTVAGVVDFIGYGSTPTSSETARTGTALTTTTSAQRKTVPAPGVDTDNNSADFAVLTTPTPTKSSAGVPTPLDAGSASNKTGTVGQAITGFTLVASGGTSPYSWSASGLPDGVSISTGGAVSGTPTTAGSYSVTATVTDGASPAATDTVSFTITVAEPAVLKTIAEVQGDGARSPFAPETGTGAGTQNIAVEGIVTGMFADVSWAGTSSGFDGMYVQTAGTGGSSDTTEGQSDAIFVYGSNSMPAGVALGDSVRVVGRISEFAGTTEITPASGGVTELGSPLAAVTPLQIAYPTTESGREAQEGMLLAPTDTFTVTDSYSTNGTGEVGLATGTTPLKQPTEFVEPSDTAGIQAIKDENTARGVMLDDGASINYQQNQTTKGQPVPYLTSADGSPNPIRVGAEATLESPVILEFRSNGAFGSVAEWRLQPQSPVFLNGADVATFEDTRVNNLAPANVGGDLKIATFNVLNYFNTTGEAYVAAGPLQNPPIDTHCTYYNDRQSNRIGNNSCGVRLLDDPSTTTNEANSNDGRGPRGAATADSLARQEEKLANTINALNADVIGLEEVENSIKLPGETNRDDALKRIVQILNDDAGYTQWAFVKSPGEAVTAAAVAEQDVIRPAFIYQVDSVSPVGQSDILFGTTQFANAREPLAQAFKAKGAPDSDAFAVIVNHFKSKGDNGFGAPPASGDNTNDDFTGVGAFNGDRVRQAQRLVQFADDFAADRDIEAVFLAGDFNAYTMEDPITTLVDGGYELVESDDHDDESYSYQGNSGSLDHMLGNAAAAALVTGADIWEINADESAAFQYSRYNYNVTNFWQPDLPFGTSDHNPEIVGIDVPDFVPTTYKEIQVIGTNDFHGRLLPDAGNAAGAAPFATAIKELESENPNSIFVAAGDLVGASTFESFIQEDKPTIDALNAMGLEVSAAGNHEFDRGYEDFVGRIQARADWEYIAANVVEPEGRDDLAETFTKTIDGVKIGFVGAVTEDLPALVNPAGIEGVTVTDIVDATNAAAAELKSGAEPADLVVLLVHEGSPTTDCTSPNFTDDATVWGNIVQNTSADVDAIVSGHTHLAYNCRYAVQEWVDGDRDVTRRPVVSAGQYGTNLNKLVFRYNGSNELVGITQDVIGTAGLGYAPDAEVQTIVDDAVAYAATAGGQVLGQMDGPFNRAQYLPTSGATENRGGESTLSNQVAEVQRWATDSAGIDTDIAFMNPGGLRADMAGTPNTELPDLQELSYRQAADVQPFANTLVNMELTGAQIETVLEQQWQRNAQGGVPSRPFLRLGVSQGFTYTYVETPETVNAPNSAPVSTFKGEVTGMWLDGEPIDPAATYGVTVNSFLGSGGDNFWELANGTDKVDSGKVDLEAMVNYMEQYDAAHPLPVDYSQHAVELTPDVAAPAVYEGGDHVILDVASWTMSAPGDLQDSEIDVLLDGESIGTATVDNAIGTLPYDNYGTAHVDVVLPAAVPDGEVTLMLVGHTTGTQVPVVVTMSDGLPDTVVTGSAADYVVGQTGQLDVAIDPTTATGAVNVYDEDDTWLGAANLTDGEGSLPLSGLAVGSHDLTLVYPGDDGHSGDTGAATVTVTKAAPVVVAGTPTPASVVKNSGTSSIAVTVSASNVDPTGTVTATVNGVVMDTETLSDGAATLVVGPFSTAGTKTVTVDYLGDDQVTTGSTTTTVTVTEPTPPPAPEPVDTTTAASAGPMVYGTAGSVSVTVTSTKPTTGGVQLLDGSTVLASGTPSATGTATLTIPGTALAVGSHALTVKYLGDTNTKASQGAVTVVVGKADSATSAAVTPAQVVVRQGVTTVHATVSAAGFTPTGSVEVLVDGVNVATRTLSNGSVTVELPAFQTVGTRSVSVAYLGDGNAEPSQSTAGSIKVVKATPTMTVTQTTDKVVVDKTRARLVVTLAAPGQTVTGDVRIKWDGRTMTETLDGQRAVFTLPKFDQKGTYTVKVVYLGSNLAEKVTQDVEIKVVKNRKN